MKHFKLIILALTAIVASATTYGQDKKINTTKSTITWVGKKLTGKHSGTIDIKDGTLSFKNNVLVAGSITVDMNSIAVTDLKSGDGKEDLEKHLKNDDFFGTQTYPTASLVFTNVKPKGKNNYTITGNLTIKDKTNPVTFDLSIQAKKANANLIIDRTKYGIVYKSASIFSTLGDKVIYDDFELTTQLHF